MTFRMTTCLGDGLPSAVSDVPESVDGVDQTLGVTGPATVVKSKQDAPCRIFLQITLDLRGQPVELCLEGVLGLPAPGPLQDEIDAAEK